MLFKRQFVSQLYEGQLSDRVMGSDTKIVDISDKDLKQVIIQASSIGGGQLSASDTDTVPLPDGYVDTSYLQATFIIEGECKIVVTSPDHDASTVLCKGDSTTPGMHQITERITQIQVVNYDSVNAARVNYCLVTLPDISDEDSFRGLTSEGDWNTTS